MGIGCNLYEMVAGKTPFAAENEQDVYKNIIGHTKNGIKFPPDLSQIYQQIVQTLSTSYVCQRAESYCC